jgi:hypothetical protein
MTTIPTPRQWQTDRLATLLDALDGVPISDVEHRSLTWLCGFEADTVERFAAVITRAREDLSSHAVALSYLITEVSALG